MFTIFLQQILSTKLLWVVISKQKNNFCGSFKLKLITTCHLQFVVKVL